MRRHAVLAPLLAAALALGAGCADEDDEGVDAGDGETSTTLGDDDGSDGGADTEPSDESDTENGVVEGEGDAVEGDGTETDEGGPGGASDEGDDSGGGATGSGGYPQD